MAMLGGECSSCCDCSADERYAIWQRLVASSCSVSVQSDNKPQHAATCVVPGFANGGTVILNKYFPQQEDAYSALRFFYRPTPDFNGTRQLSVDLSQGTFWVEGIGSGSVRWRYSTVDMSITVRAYVGVVPSQAYVADLSPGGTSDTALIPFVLNPVFLTGRCPVYYTIQVAFLRYNFYSRVSKYDPSPFALTQYTGNIPAESGGGSFTTNLASAGAPIAYASAAAPDYETTFFLGASPSASTNISGNTSVMQAWWQQYLLTLTDQQMRDTLTLNPSALDLRFGSLSSDSNEVTLASMGETICLPSDGTLNSSDAVGVGTIRLPYQNPPWQWVNNSDPKWISQPSFAAFWNISTGARMSVQGSLFPYRYAVITDSNFSTSFSITVTDE
jgi:hypothetical protein